MSERWYTCTDEFELTTVTDPGNAIYDHLDTFYPLKPYEKLPVHVTLFEWECSGEEIDEGILGLRLVSRQEIHVATWCKENAPYMMGDCVAPGEEGETHA